MALGTVTVVSRAPLYAGQTPGSGSMVIADVVPSAGANYTQGGESVTAAALGLSSIWGAFAVPTTQAATVGPGTCAPLVQAGGASLKLQCNLAANTGDNASNADLHLTLVRLTVWGV